MVTELILAASQSSDGAKPDLITTLVGAGPFGVLAALFIWGLVIPKKSYDDVAADRDYWREAWKQECDAHQKTREALKVSDQRGDVAVEAASTTARVLDSLQHVVHKNERA